MAVWQYVCLPTCLPNWLPVYLACDPCDIIVYVKKDQIEMSHLYSSVNYQWSFFLCALFSSRHMTFALFSTTTVMPIEFAMSKDQAARSHCSSKRNRRRPYIHPFVLNLRRQNGSFSDKTRFSF